MIKFEYTPVKKARTIEYVSLIWIRITIEYVSLINQLLIRWKSHTELQQTSSSYHSSKARTTRKVHGYISRSSQLNWSTVGTSAESASLPQMWWNFRQLVNRVLNSGNGSVCLIWFRSTFVVTFTFTRVQKPKCPIKLMTKAGIYGFRSSPGYDSQLRDSNFVLHLQSIARSKPKLLLRNHNRTSFALRSQSRIQ